MREEKVKRLVFSIGEGLVFQRDFILLDQLPEAVADARPVDNIHAPGQVGFGKRLLKYRRDIDRQWALRNDHQVQVGVGLGSAFCSFGMVTLLNLGLSNRV